MSHLMLAAKDGQIIQTRKVPHPEYLITADMHDLKRMKEAYDLDLNKCLWIHMAEANKTVPGATCMISRYWKNSQRAFIMIAILRVRGVVLINEDGSLFDEDKGRLSEYQNFNSATVRRLFEEDAEGMFAHQLPEPEGTHSGI